MQFRKTKAILALVFSFMAVATAGAQSIPDSTAAKIDSLFAKWNNANSPGASIGIVRNDSLVYAKGYGLANLEYGLSNTPQTIFHMASISKQFTAWSILTLVKQGKLSLNDDVRKWLPWFPDLKKKITIQHLLNHTSGIRDQWQLLAISGTRLDDVITQEQIVKLLSKQQALNFNPGEKYSYSNSGFTMLAEIVKAVTTQTLRQFTDSVIFRPLAMNSTHFHDDYTEIEKNRSYSYDRKDSAHFTNSVLSYSNAGATSLFTNIPDMSKWVMQLTSTNPGNQQLVSMLTEKGKLNSGAAINYSNGIVADTYKGWRQYSHGGADAGYRTYLSVFPDLKMGFMVFSNLGDFNAGGMAHNIADLFIKDTTQNKPAEKAGLRDSAAAVLNNDAVWQKYTGYYIGEDGLPFSFELKNRQLFYHIFNQSSFLIRGDKDTFSFPEDANIKFVFSIKARDTTCDVFTPDQLYHIVKYKRDTLQTEFLLKQYTGTYYCPELDCKYGIIIKDHHLVLTNSKYSDATLTIVNKDHLTNDNWWISHLAMRRNGKNEITGFDVNSGRIMHLKFNKLAL